ncbi:MAG: SlyX family protein [Alphaproteobacteria bacterium]|jgi:SlyX protein|nr:SlyX family protein [Alphaproteobacteria bacterium]
MTTDAQRIAELEIRLAHQEQAADELSAVVAEQANLVELLREQVRRLSGQMGELAEVVSDKAPDDPPPPHY